VDISASNYGVRHLFTGQQWYSELGLYDLRNRFYSPDIGRFLQPDPIDFDGDATNLYRYCGNNPLNCVDPLGLFRPAQFTKGALAFTGGFTFMVAGAALSTTGVGAIGGIPLLATSFIGFNYGIMNIVASFSDQTDAVVAETYPSNLGGAAGRIAYGKTGQHIGSGLENIFSLSQAEGKFEMGLSALNVGLDWYDIVTSDLFGSANGLGNGLGVPADNDIVGYDANGNEYARVSNAGPNVTATYPIVPGVTYPDANGGTFHMGTTGNIYRGPASTTEIGFGASYGELRPGMISGLGLAGAGMGTPGMGGSLGTWGTYPTTQEQHKNFWGN
jgi:RHS repeat-associated protein